MPRTGAAAPAVAGPLPPAQAAGQAALTRPGFDAIAAYLKSHSGLLIGPDKVYLLETRLGGIMKQHGLADLRALSDRLRIPGQDKLGAEVVEAMTTNESFFFRDEKPFTHVRTNALPRLVAARPPTHKLRFWSAASSSGQEAYSLAMIMLEQRAMVGERKVEIVGTDIAREQLARARTGLYSQFEVQRGLPVTALVKHFAKETGGWRIKEPLRAMVEFREWNLLNDLRPLGQFDLIFCRNVLIYFDVATKTRTLDAISRQLAPDGLLYLGGAETVLGITDRFVPIPNERGVYALSRAAQ